MWVLVLLQVFFKSNFVGMWSGPVALCSLSVHSSLWMPFGVIVMCCMGGCGLMPLSG